MNTLILAVCFNVLMFALVIAALVVVSRNLPPNESIITTVANIKFVVVALLAIAGSIIVLNRISRLKEAQ